jgi:hypothetical protein
VLKQTFAVSQTTVLVLLTFLRELERRKDNKNTQNTSLGTIPVRFSKNIAHMVQKRSDPTKLETHRIAAETR